MKTKASSYHINHTNGLDKRGTQLHDITQLISNINMTLTFIIQKKNSVLVKFSNHFSNFLREMNIKKLETYIQK